MGLPHVVYVMSPVNNIGDIVFGTVHIYVGVITRFWPGFGSRMPEIGYCEFLGCQQGAT